MSYTRARVPGSSTMTRNDAAAAPPNDDDVKCLCPVPRRAVRRRSGPQAKNPGRWFYGCPLPLGDTSRCKFFKWDDALPSDGGGGRNTLGGGPAVVSGNRTIGASVSMGGIPTTPRRRSAAEVAGGGGQTTPGRIGDWFSPHRNARPVASQPTPSKAPASGDTEGDGDDIDWTAVDAAALEADAADVAARTPARSQQTPIGGGVGSVPATPTLAGPSAPVSASSLAATGRVVTKGTPASRLQDRLLAAGVQPKRKREDEADEPTPKRQGNPFIDSNAAISATTASASAAASTSKTTPRPAGQHTPLPAPAHTPISAMSARSFQSAGSALGADDAGLPSAPNHPALTPLLVSIEGLSEHLARQERLVRAAEAMKRSMRATIHNLQERVRELEAENAALRKG